MKGEYRWQIHRNCTFTLRLDAQLLDGQPVFNEYTGAPHYLILTR